MRVARGVIVEEEIVAWKQNPGVEMEFATYLRNALKERIGEERFALWFSDVVFEADERVVCVLASTSFQLDRLRKNFQEVLSLAAADVGVVNAQVRFQVGEPGFELLQQQAATLETNEAPSLEPLGSDASVKTEPAINLPTIKNIGETGAVATGVPATGVVKAPMRLQASSSPIRKRRFQTFATFVEGECNQIARSSAQMVVKQLGEVSPLVIHGPTGVGKSHLVEAIWCEARQRSRRSSVLYLSAEQYTTYFLDALRGGSGLPAFRRKYRQADLLVIDDIQFFAGKQATLVELAYTIDSLARDNRQLILTADRPPNQLGKLGPEIVNRLCGGLVCGMKPVDYAAMVQISKQWSQERKIVVDDVVHQLIASKTQGDARQLSGVLNRLRATSIATGEPITARMVNEVAYELIPSPSRIIRLQDVRKAISEVFGIEEESLKTSTRSRAVATPRMLAMWLSRRHTAAGFHEISSFFGRRSHSSAVSAISKVNQWMTSAAKVEIGGHECDIRDVVSQIENNLRAG